MTPVVALWASTTGTRIARLLELFPRTCKVPPRVTIACLAKLLLTSAHPSPILATVALRELCANLERPPTPDRLSNGSLLMTQLPSTSSSPSVLAVGLARNDFRTMCPMLPTMLLVAADELTIVETFRFLLKRAPVVDANELKLTDEQLRLVLQSLRATTLQTKNVGPVLSLTLLQLSK